MIWSGVHREPAKLLLIAFWFALVTGLAEVLLLTIAKLFLNRYINYFGRDIIWMAPLAELFLFGVVALILLLLAWLWPRLDSPRVVIFCFAFLFFIGLVLMYKRLDIYAALLLAIGLAVQTARFLTSDINRFYRFARRTTPWMVAVVSISSIGILGWQSMAERRTLAKLPSAQPDAPNVLVIVMDTVRARNLSVYGYARSTTPQLEKTAKSGVVFERAIATASWTLPSHASMFTGRYPHELSVGFAAGLDATYPTLAEVLSEHGYATAGFIANTAYCGPSSGLNRGFGHYEDLAASPGQVILSSSLGRAANDSSWLRRTIGYNEKLSRKTAPELNESVLRWLSRKDPQRPFFVFLNYFDAHAPYLPPEPFDVKFGSKQSRGNPRLDPFWSWSPLEIQAEMDAYDGSIAYLDHHIGMLLDQLEKRELLDNTLIIVTSDHGEEFGEHGLMDHAYSLYLPLLHVPLLVSLPGRAPAGISVKEPVSLRDLPATVMDLLKLKNESRFPGASLARCWNDANAPESSGADPLLSELEFTPNLPESYPISKGDMKSLVTAEYHFIRNGDSREELYNYLNDPLEQRNLSHSDASLRTLDRLRASLDSLLSRKRTEEISQFNH